MGLVVDDVLRGVDRLLTAYLDLQPHDQPVITYEVGSREAAAWLAVGLRQRACAPYLVPRSSRRDDTLEARLRVALPSPDTLTGHLILFVIDRDPRCLRDVLSAVRGDYGDRCKLVRLIGDSASFFADALGPLPFAADSHCGSVPAGQRWVRFRGRAGTDLLAVVDPMAWTAPAPSCTRGHILTLPADRVSTVPISVTGRFVADGGTRLTVDVVGGRVTAVRSLRVGDERCAQLAVGTRVARIDLERYDELLSLTFTSGLELTCAGRAVSPAATIDLTGLPPGEINFSAGVSPTAPRALAGR